MSGCQSGRTGEGTAIERQTFERSVLCAALEEIQSLAAPRQIDRVAAILGMDMVEFAKLGPAKMSAVIWARLELDQIAAGRSSSAAAKGTKTNSAGD